MTDQSGPTGEPLPASGTHRAVFLSYASQDKEAAGRICAGLRSAGVEVWFDQHELRGGAAWDATIRKQIKSCALFIPIISGNTRARVEGYFRLEWKLAVDRSHLMAAERPFLLPVGIDDIAQDEALVPDKFHEVQWTWLSAGAPSPDFLHQLLRLLRLGENQVAIGAGPVATVDARRARPSVAAEPWTPAPGQESVSEQSIAVLPFVDISQHRDQEYFADGLTEELISLLTRVQELRVPARTSCFYFKGKQSTIAEVAHALRVAHVLEGSVRKSGNMVRIAVQLIRADTGYHIWAQNYDRTLDDIFKVQDEIAGSVVQSLSVTLLHPATQTRTAALNPEAYQFYLHGKFHWNRRSPEEFKKAIGYFQQAIAVEPHYAAALAGLANCYALLPIYDHLSTATTMMPQAKSATLRALAADDNLPEAHASLGLILGIFGYEWQAAEREYLRAIELNPNVPEPHQWYGELLVNSGRFEAGLAQGRRAVELDPLSRSANLALGIQLNSARRYEEAIGQLQITLELERNFADVNYFLFEAYANLGSYSQAVAAYAQQQRLDGELASTIDEFMEAFVSGSWFGFLQCRIRRLDSQGQADCDQAASLCARAGDLDRAFAWLEKSYAGRSARLTHLKVDARYDNLRTDPRFADLLNRVGLA